MSENDDVVSGPAMLAATNMLKPPPTVIGSLNKQMALPRTVRLTTLIAALVGAIAGFLAAFIAIGPGPDSLIYGPLLGGAAGWAATNLSPLPGESLAVWLGLQANNTRRRKSALDGRPARLYVGIAPLRRTAAGTVRMLPGGVTVHAVNWDERGFPLQEIPGASRLPGRPRHGRKLTASTSLSSARGMTGKRRRGRR
jgi:hypothetical protein